MKIIEPSVELVDFIDADEVLRKIELCGRVSHQSESRGDPENFIRKIIKLGHESVLEHVSLTFHIICNRAIQNELVRHRHASFTVESTRYVKYSDATFIKPTGLIGAGFDYWLQHISQVEQTYGTLLDLGTMPEVARDVLNLGLKSELYMTANLREWRHVLKLRTAKAAHPQMRFIAGKILDILRDKLPVIVEDIRSD